MSSPPGQVPPPPAGPPWGPLPASSPRTSRATKWVLGGLALLVVVVVTVVATLLVARNQTGSPQTASETTVPSVDISAVASANDKGPASLILDDPTCISWAPIADALAEQQADGWIDRDPTIDSKRWTTEQRRQYEDVADAMRLAADRSLMLAEMTPHRVMRELYEQSAAYWRAYADRVPNYEPADDHLANAVSGTSNALVWICSAMESKAAEAQAPFLIDAAPPLKFSPVDAIANPQPFLEMRTRACEDWRATVADFQAQIGDWLAIDPSISADQWTPAQQEIYVRTATIMEINAGQLQNIGVQSGNPVFQDFATLAAQYRRAYISAIPSYRPSDNYLASAASQLVAAIDEACTAAGP